MADPPSIAVVVVAYASGGDLPRSLGALRDQLRPGDEVVVVDNASPDDSAAVAQRVMPEATIVEMGVNSGFAGGSNAGAAAAGADIVLLLNPDCVAQPGFLDGMRTAAVEHPDWGAWQALVTLPGGEEVNTAGNVVHFLGFGWAGDWGRAVDDVAGRDREIGFASGAAMAIRREAWDAAGGFDERYFMYGEDLDLSLRLRLAGWAIGAATRARVEHEYAFTKGDYKWFYLERNRWWTVLGAYPGRLLVALAPALLAFEVALLLPAWRGGWLRAKVRAHAAVARELPAILRRRREVQASRRIATRAFATHLAASLDSPVLAGAAALPGVPAAQRLYWRLALLLLGR